MTKEQIINETVNYIKKNGRAVTKLGSMCLYQTLEGIGCAVGRCIDKRKYSLGWEGIGDVHELTSQLGASLDDLLKKKYRGHSIGFWEDLQNLHDDSHLWKDNKLTDIGERRLKWIKDRWT